MVINAVPECCCSGYCSITSTLKQAVWSLLPTCVNWMCPDFRLDTTLVCYSFNSHTAIPWHSTSAPFIQKGKAVWNGLSQLWKGSCFSKQTHHSELLQFLVPFDEEGTLFIACSMAITLASPTCRGKINIAEAVYNWVKEASWVKPLTTWQHFAMQAITYSCVPSKNRWENYITEQGMRLFLQQWTNAWNKWSFVRVNLQYYHNKLSYNWE